MKIKFILCFLLSHSLFLLSAQPDMGIAQRNRLQQLSKSMQTKIQKQLTSNDRSVLKQMQIEAQSITRIRSARLQRQKVIQFNQKYAGFRSKIMQKAGINNRSYLDQVKRILPQYQFKHNGNSLVAQKTQSLRITNEQRPTKKPKYTYNRGKRIPAPPTSISSTQFEILLEQTGCNGYTGNFAQDQSFSAFSTASVAGGCETVKGLGSNLQIPAGTQEVRVQVTLDDGFVLSNAALGVLGYGQNYTEVGIRVKGPGVDQYFKDSEQFAFAPVAFFADIDKEESGQYIMEIRFNPSPNGGTYRIQAYGKSFSLGIGGGMGVGYAQLRELNKVEVHFQ